MGLYKAKEVWTGTLASSIPDAATTSFTLTSSSGLTNGETYVFTIDRVDVNGTKTPNKKEVIIGTVSGSNVIDCIRGVEGTAQAHSAGAIVEILFTAKHWNDFIESFKAQHREDGTHSKIQGLDNNQAITQKDSAGTERSIIKLNASNILEIGDSNLAGQQFNTPLVNNTAIKQRDSTGTARDILNLNSSNDLEIGGAGISSYKLNNSIIKPSSDSTSAIKITKADGTSHILNIDTINERVGIGTNFPTQKLHIVGNIRISDLNFLILDTNTLGGSPNVGAIAFGDGTGWRLHIAKASDNGATKFVTFQDNGNVGIGITTPGYKLDVNGQCHASSFPTSSDKRFKENVKEIDNALEKVKKLRGVYFNWNKFYRETLKVDETEDTEIGVIAQEVKEVIPEVVTTFEREVDGEKEKFYSVEYARLSALLINAIKELAEKVENLEKKYGEINNSRT